MTGKDVNLLLAIETSVVNFLLHDNASGASLAAYKHFNSSFANQRLFVQVVEK